MSSLSHRDYERLLDLAAAAAGEIRPDDCWRTVCEGAIDLLDASLAGVFDICPGRAPQGRSWPAWAQRATSTLPDVLSQHPFVRHYTTGRDSAPHTVSDLVTRREWQRNVLYAPLMSDFGGAVRQLAIPLPAPAGDLRTVVLGRPGRDFDDRDRACAARLQPLLAGLDRRLRMFDRPDAAGLTPRELDVLAMLAEGRTAVAMARRLAVSTHTVAKHQQNIYRKLGTNDRLTTVLRAQHLRIPLG